MYAIIVVQSGFKHLCTVQITHTKQNILSVDILDTKMRAYEPLNPMDSKQTGKSFLNASSKSLTLVNNSIAFAPLQLVLRGEIEH